MGRDIKTGSDPGVSPLTSVNPRGQIFSNCAITRKMSGAAQNEWMDVARKSGNLEMLRVYFKRGDSGSADM